MPQMLSIPYQLCIEKGCLYGVFGLGPQRRLSRKWAEFPKSNIQHQPAN